MKQIISYFACMAIYAMGVAVMSGCTDKKNSSESSINTASASDKTGQQEVKFIRTNCKLLYASGKIEPYLYFDLKEDSVVGIQIGEDISGEYIFWGLKSYQGTWNEAVETVKKFKFGKHDAILAQLNTVKYSSGEFNRTVEELRDNGIDADKLDDGWYWISNKSFSFDEYYSGIDTYSNTYNTNSTLPSKFQIKKKLFYRMMTTIDITIKSIVSTKIPTNLVLDKAKTLDKGGACYAMKPVSGKQGDFFPAMVMFTNKGIVIGVSAGKPDHFGYELGEKTDYFFYYNAEINVQNIDKIGRPGDIALLYENGQWNVVVTEARKESSIYRAVYPVAGKVSTKKLEQNTYTPKMNPDLWKPKTMFQGDVIVGSYVLERHSWPFSLDSAVNQQ